MRKNLYLLIFLFCLSPLSFAADVVLTLEVKWEPLNPARGDQSPQAGALWGERTGPGPAGFLLKPVDGFRSPPHIHNVSYRGVVISGLLHNDHPNAADMWMPTGSFWTQPAGGIHITAAKGKNALAYIEIEDAFGVLPAKKAFKSDEKPVNVDVSNLVWLDQPKRVSPGVMLAYLWGSPQNDQFYGTLMKLPAGLKRMIHSEATILRAVLIQGQLIYLYLDGTNQHTMEPGSYFGSEDKSFHQIECVGREECIIYLRTNGKFNVS